jgi:hypothetical protein
MTMQQRRLGQAAIRIGRAFGIGGQTWAATYVDAAGATVSRGAIAPLYIVQELPTKLEIALAVAEVPRARWRLIAASIGALAVSDLITNGTLTFRVTALDSIGLPGVTLGTLEKINTS